MDRKLPAAPFENIFPKVANGWIIFFIKFVKNNAKSKVSPCFAWNIEYEKGATNTMAKRIHSMAPIVIFFLFFFNAPCIL